MRLVVDTNVLVSGLLSAAGPSARIIDLVTDGVLVVCFDQRILDEYGDVLHRPRFAFDPLEIAALLAQVEGDGLRIQAHPLTLALPGPGDLKFIEVAVAARADCLVTGNRRHFPPGQRQDVIVVSPRELDDMLRQ